MPLGMEIGLGPGDIVLNEHPPLPPHGKGHGSPALFGPCLLSPTTDTAELLFYWWTDFQSSN